MVGNRPLSSVASRTRLTVSRRTCRGAAMHDVTDPEVREAKAYPYKLADGAICISTSKGAKS